MSSKFYKRKLSAALVMGALTLLVSLVIADHFIGLSQTPAHQLRGVMAHIILYVGLVAFPMLFYRKTSWVYTLFNLPLYFILYFLIAEVAGSTFTHYFLRRTGGFIEFPDYFGAGITMVFFWSAQSIVFLVLWGLKKIKSHKNT